MRLREIHQALTETRAESWRRIHAPIFLDKIQKWTGGGEGWGIDIVEHSDGAALREDVNLTIAWGMERARDLRFPSWSEFPDPAVHSAYLDVFWAGAHVDRFTYAQVDGYRGLFLMPSRVAGEDTLTEAEIAVGDLLMSFSYPESSREYARSAGIRIVPGGLERD
jgi:hypothetical protein